MKKKGRLVFLAVVLVLALATNAGASMLITSITRDLSFSGNTANCSASIRDNGKTICATMELWCGNVPLGSWSDSDTSSVDLDGSLNVATGMTYTLKVYGTVNGVHFEATPVIKSN